MSIIVKNQIYVMIFASKLFKEARNEKKNLAKAETL